MNYTKDDQETAPEGHLPIPDTDVEVVVYRSNERLTLIVNKAGIAAYRCTITNAFTEGVPNSTPPLDPAEDTFVLRMI